MESWVTMEEAAELENISYKTFHKRTERGGEKYKTRCEKRPDGGKDIVMVAVSSLSKQARTAWKEREKLKALAEVPETDLTPEAVKQERPWYVDCDLDWYMDAYPGNYYKGVELGNIVRGFLSYGYSDRDRAAYAEEYAREHLGKGARTLYRHTKTYMEACAWANKLQKETGQNWDFVKILCLCRKPKETGRFPSLTDPVKATIKNIWFNKDFAANQGTMQMLYEKLEDVCKANKIDKVPSYQTVCRYITYLMEDEQLQSEWYLASRGMREWKNKVMVKSGRDTTVLSVMEVLMGDAHTFDCWVAYTQPNGKVTAIRPHLVAWIDVRSRDIVGDILTKDPNADTMKASMLKVMYGYPGRVPRYLYVDNGKDFTAKELTGRARNERYDLPDFDSAQKGFYKAIGIETDHRAAPFSPWLKGQIERSFRTHCMRFAKMWRSYTGTLTGSRTDGKVPKDIKAMLSRGELPTMEEFTAEWAKYLEKYRGKVHSALKKAGEEFRTPGEMMEGCTEQYFKPPVPKEYATILMMKDKRAFFRQGVINKFGVEYHTHDLDGLPEGYVDVKWDPNDLTTLYLFDGSKRIGTAYNAEPLPFMVDGEATEDMKKHWAHQQKQRRQAQEQLAELQRPAEEQFEGWVGVTKDLGGIDLMYGPEKKRKAKVVQLPRDRAYRSGFRPGQEKQEQEASEYLKKQYEEARRIMRAGQA